MNSEHDLIEKIKHYSNIIVYGAKIRGMVLLERLNFHMSLFSNTDIFVAVTNTNGDKMYVGGVKRLDTLDGNEYFKKTGYLVKNIADLTHISKSCVILIAASPQYHEEMEKTAASLGFANIIRISESMHSEMTLRNDVFTTARKIDELSYMEKYSQFLQYSVLNQIRLERLRDKIRHKKRIKIIFPIANTGHPNLFSVYRALEGKNELFDCAFFCFDLYADVELRKWTNDAFNHHLDAMRLFYNQLQTYNFNVIWGYDDNNNPIALETYSPDIIIHALAHLILWDHLDAEQHIKRIITKYLSCYIPYGMHVSNEFKYHFDHDGIYANWLHFIDTRQALDLCANFAVTRGANAVLAGHPQLDEYFEPLINISKKIPQRPMVIYAPHWSVDTWHNTSTFHIHHRVFLELMKKYPDINFIFRPHKELGLEIYSNQKTKKTLSISYEDYVDYRRTWAESPNGILEEDGSFINLFKQADCLITDCYSFITFWLPTDKPCMFLMNPEGPEDPYKYYYDFIHPVIDSYYICKTTEEIEKTFKDVVIDLNDPKAEQRRIQSKNLIYNLGHAGEFIADYIEKQLTD